MGGSAPSPPPYTGRTLSSLPSPGTETLRLSLLKACELWWVGGWVEGGGLYIAEGGKTKHIHVCE